MEKESLNSGEKLTRRETQPPVETRSALPGSNGRRPFIVKTLAKVPDWTYFMQMRNTNLKFYFVHISLF